MKKKNNKFKKTFTFIAVIGAAAAAAIAYITKFRKKNEDLTDDISNDDDDFDSLDLSSVNNDTPRDYVSIKINSTDNSL